MPSYPGARCRSSGGRRQEGRVWMLLLIFLVCFWQYHTKGTFVYELTSVSGAHLRSSPALNFLTLRLPLLDGGGIGIHSGDCLWLLCVISGRWVRFHHRPGRLLDTHNLLRRIIISYNIHACCLFLFRFEVYVSVPSRVFGWQLASEMGMHTMPVTHLQTTCNWI